MGKFSVFRVLGKYVANLQTLYYAICRDWSFVGSFFILLGSGKALLSFTHSNTKMSVVVSLEMRTVLPRGQVGHENKQGADM